jgi:serine protease Do
MRIDFFRHRWIWGAPVLALAIALILGIPQLSKSATPQVWTERPPAHATAATPTSMWVALARELKPAVVNVSTTRVQQGTQMNGPDDEPFSQFFKQFGHQRRTVHSLGSGFVINRDGYVATNNHVVDGATEIKVTLSDGREFTAKVLGRDPKTDLALLKVDATALPVIPLGDSTKLEVGEPVMAIGNPFGLEQTVTTGIVSATGRVIGEGPYDNFIQTDASINPGNSGGPLINTRGEAVGINTAILSQTGGSVGIGFSIPVNVAKPVFTQLASAGHVTRGYLGVEIQRVTSELAKSFKLPAVRGALVASVVDGSPAQKAGLRPGDVITEYDGHVVARSDDLPLVVAETPVGRDVRLTVVRGGAPVTLTAHVGKLADAEEPAAAEAKSKSSLGLSVQTLTANLADEVGLREKKGVLVRGVEDGSPAATAGLRPGDVIAEVDHKSVASVDEMKRELDSRKPGAPVLFLVHRRGTSLYVAVSV